MKLQSVKYSNSEKWNSTEYIPDNPRSILVFTEEGGVAEASYQNGKWIQFRWHCEVNPLYWREMPKYESKDSF